MTIYESYTRSVESLYVECTVVAASDSSIFSAGILSFVKNFQARKQEMRMPYKSARFISEICKSGGNSSINSSSKMCGIMMRIIYKDLQLTGETEVFII